MLGDPNDAGNYRRVGRSFGRKSVRKYKDYYHDYLEWGQLPNTRVMSIEHAVITHRDVQMGNPLDRHSRHIPHFKDTLEMVGQNWYEYDGPFYTLQPLPYPSNTPAAKERSMYKGRGRAGARKKKR